MENRFKIEEIQNFVRELEKMKIELLDGVEQVLRIVRIKGEIRRVEHIVSKDYSRIGMLVFEMDRMNKELYLEDFREELDRIEEYRAYKIYLEEELNKLQRLADSSVHNTREAFGDFFVTPEVEIRDTDTVQKMADEEYINCPNCGHSVPKYFRFCSNCDEEL